METHKGTPREQNKPSATPSSEACINAAHFQPSTSLLPATTETKELKRRPGNINKNLSREP